MITAGQGMKGRSYQGSNPVGDQQPGDEETTDSESHARKMSEGVLDPLIENRIAKSS